MAERLFNVGYVGMVQEVSPNTPLTPTDYLQAYDVGLSTQRNFEKIAPAAGNVYGTQQTTPGLRDHTGDMTLVFEANTAEKLAAMMLSVGSKTGTGPYTSTGTLSPSAPNTYTIDVSSGNIVNRYYGCQVSKLATEVSGNEIRIKPTISAVGSFDGREIASMSGTGPYTIVLKTDYDPSPTTGLVAADLIRFYLANGTTVDATVTSVTNGTTFTTTVNPAGVTAGDMIYIRPATPSFNMLPPVLWSNTQFCFGATASAALAATQTRVEPGSMWELIYDFKDAKGEHRSGGQDPAVLLRKPSEANLTIKKYFDNPEDIEAFNNMEKSACVVRHFIYYNSNTYEFRVTFNHLTTNDPIPKYKAGEINYSEIKYIASYDTSDGQAYSVTIINNNATLT